MAIRTDFTAGEVLAAQDLNDTFLSKLDLAGGKVLQVVRATDTTDRSTTSATAVDANISVTITPKKSDSAIILIWSVIVLGPASSGQASVLLITDNSNNAISGAQNSREVQETTVQKVNTVVLIAYSTPATLSATTYKGRFFTTAGTTTLRNSTNSTGQLFAIEVSA